ncbi:hypothetical protein [uncultured Tateyamaria sp.]|uniref:hypothetical protein n=1 Tax=uncultured Tateyamaria sp. TaxID=455651 RepID=UPI00260E26F9|nr:hypothetical protein [uncultured Tateyamaria sp.]
MTKPTRIIAALALNGTLAACAAPITQRQRLELDPGQLNSVKRTASYNLKYPESARFRDIRWFENRHQDGTISNTVCGEVNARNSFGGYAGYATFKGRMNGGKFVMFGVAPVTNPRLFDIGCPP